jgi:hypothetical protein
MVLPNCQGENVVRESIRVEPAVEEEGLDVPVLGMPAYPEDAVVPASY